MNHVILILCLVAALQVDRIVSSVIAGIIDARRNRRAREKLKAIGATWGPDTDYAMQLYPMPERRSDLN